MTPDVVAGDPAAYVAGWRFTVTERVAVDRETLWDRLADLPRIGEWSPECRWAEWLDPVAGARAGAGFRARNRAGDDEWDVTGRLLEVDRPHLLSWCVDDGSGARSSTWSYRLEPDPAGGTVATASFAHGPGESGVLLAIAEDPEHPAEVVAFRERLLIDNIVATLRAIETTVTTVES